jgi:hypothetical protein
MGTWKGNVLLKWDGVSQTRVGAGRPGFDSQQGRNFSLRCRAETGCGTHPVSCPLVTGGFLLPEGKAAGS